MLYQKTGYHNLLSDFTPCIKIKKEKVVHTSTCGCPPNLKAWDHMSSLLEVPGEDYDQ
jgi:hypothetical protein